MKLFKLPKLVRVAAPDFFLAQLQIASKSWTLQKSLPMVEPIFAISKSLLLQFYTRKAKKRFTINKTTLFDWLIAGFVNFFLIFILLFGGKKVRREIVDIV